METLVAATGASSARASTARRVPVATELRALGQQVHDVHASVQLLLDSLAESEAANAARRDADRTELEWRLDANESRIDQAEKRLEVTDTRIDRERNSIDARFDRIDRELVHLAKRSERWGRLTAGAGGFLCILGLVANDFPVLQAVARAVAVVAMGEASAATGVSP